MPRRLRPRFLLAFGSVAPQAPRKTRILVVLITKLPGRRQVAPTRADHFGPPSLHDPSGSFASPELPRLRLSQRLVPRRALTLDLMRALVPRTSSLHDACTHKSPSLKIFQSLLHPDLGRPNEIFPPGGAGRFPPGSGGSHALDHDLARNLQIYVRSLAPTSWSFGSPDPVPITIHAPTLAPR